MEHTPGPWCIGHVRDTTQKYQHTSFEVPVHVGAWNDRAAGPGNCLAIAYLGGPGAIDSTREAVEANARLIAAAPELFKALKAIVDPVMNKPGDEHVFCNCAFCYAWSILDRVQTAGEFEKERA